MTNIGKSQTKEIHFMLGNELNVKLCHEHNVLTHIEILHDKYTIHTNKQHIYTQNTAYATHVIFYVENNQQE